MIKYLIIELGDGGWWILNFNQLLWMYVELLKI